MTTRSHRGFTFLEVLVVIGVTGVLIGIAVPALRAARAQGKSIVCSANMRSISQAMAMYADDNNDWFPYTEHVAQVGGWIRSVGDLIQDTQVYRCPSDPSDDWFNPADSPAMQLINDRENSYAVNIYISPRQYPAPGSLDTRPKYGYMVRRMIRYPGGTVHFGELATTSGSQEAGDHFHADQWIPSFLTGVPTIEPKMEVAMKRHLRTENYAYVDGHVESHPFRETFELNEDKSQVIRDRWNPERSAVSTTGP